MRFIILTISVLSVLIFTSCKDQEKKFNIENFYGQSEQDTLMANIITHIYKVPRGADPKRKHDLEYRSLYVSQIPLFEFIHFHIEPEDSLHFFYLIRPARNERGYKRGVLGQFKVDENFKLLDFKEVAVTPMLPREEILEKGDYLWKDLMYYKHVDRYYLNKEFVEFPDERTRYDKTKHEWTYDKSNEL
ncbi:MAG: hypothetical protein EA341_14825 [Mongoliibacter sp.]|uniref:hypothetical protein n=1 Tax=Mongoliibacter sp. TaxID=2022438 RepID=UPI0012F05F07|nr:hypothetical protein [Mongoliibacter sp.]TVP45830.1 MAG: hypothetical protein EA341_14825 [Mongoliibacter sp.]